MRRGLIRQQILESPKWSDRRIASVIGVDHVTVSSARDQLEKEGMVVKFTTRVGKDDVEQPATRPPNETMAIPIPTHPDAHA